MKTANTTVNQHKQKQPKQANESRRNFLSSVAAGAAVSGVIGTGLLGSSHALADDYSFDDFDPSAAGGDRNRENLIIRRRAARQHFDNAELLNDQLDNNDENRYAGERYYASFHKTLPQNNFGEVNPNAFQQLQQAMRSGASSDFAQIPLAGIAERKLANPQGAFLYRLSGVDSHATRMSPAPRFRSRKMAGEVGELYWLALTRDVPFSDYTTNGMIQNALNDLNQFSKVPGPTIGGSLSADTIFRGETPGDLVGPYISQFLWQTVPWGPSPIEQRYEVPTAGVDYMLNRSDWLQIQRGASPAQGLTFDSQRRYIFNNRSLGEYVHRDVVFQAYLNAALILLGYGPGAIDPANPYSGAIDNQGAFVSLGAPFILDAVTTAANLSLTGAWFQKWRVHRLLRPEVYGGRIHFNMTGQRNYEINSEILNSAALTQVFSQNGTYFMPMAFTEGSPTHPSYPAGHSTIAGACTTVLKAFFNEDFVIPAPVVSNHNGSALNAFTGGDLTVGDELNKLANNITLGRDAAGVHYRSDGVQGLQVGEQQAIGLLQDYSRTINEADFDGFNFTQFDGTPVTIKDGEIS